MSNLKEKYKEITESPDADDVPEYKMQKVVSAYEKGRTDAIDEFCNVLCSNGAIADFIKDYIIEKGKEFKQCHISQ